MVNTKSLISRILKSSNKFWKSKRNIGFLLGLAILFPSLMIQAENGNANTIERPSAMEIKNRTLIIGTHLIALDGLTPEISEIALKSATYKNQLKKYYKSELIQNSQSDSDNNGYWYDIESANEVLDIAKSGNTVDAAVIDALPLEYYTDENGITYSFAAKKEVDIFSIPDPSEIESMEELKGLKQEYDAKKGETGDDKLKAQVKAMETILINTGDTVKNDDAIKEYDEEMDALRRYAGYLSTRTPEATSEEKAMLSKIRGAVAAARKIAIIDVVMKAMESVDQTNLPDQYGTSQQNLMSAQTGLKAIAGFIEFGTNDDAIVKKRVTLIKDLIDQCKKINNPNADVDLKLLVALDAIGSNTITDKDNQSKLVSDLENSAKEEWNKLINQGESAEYKAAESANKGSVVLGKLKNDYRRQLNAVKNNLVNLLNISLRLMNSKDEQLAKLGKELNDSTVNIAALESEVGLQDIGIGDKGTTNGMLGIGASGMTGTGTSGMTGTGTSGMLGKKPTDAFKDIALKSEKDRMQSILAKTGAIQASKGASTEDATNESKMKSMVLQKKKALDSNDLSKADKIQSDMNDLQKKIDDKSNEKKQQLSSVNNSLVAARKKMNSSTASDSERQAAKNDVAKLTNQASQLKLQLGGETKAASEEAASAKNSILNAMGKEKLTADDLSQIAKGVDTLVDLAKTQTQVVYPELLDAFNEIKAKLATDASAPSELNGISDKAKQSIVDNADKFGNQQDLTADTLNTKIEDFLSDKDLKDFEKNILTLGALSRMLGDTPLEQMTAEQKIIKSKMDEILRDQLAQGNMFLIPTNMKNGELYAPMETVSDILNMRYVWEPNLVRGCLTGEGKTYIFTHGRKDVASEEKGVVMSNLAIFETDRKNNTGNLWIPQGFLVDYFKLAIEEIQTTNYSGIYTDKVYSQIDDMVKSIS